MSTPMSQFVPGSQLSQCALYSIIITGQPSDCPHGSTVRNTPNGPILLDHVMRSAKPYVPSIQNINGSSPDIQVQLDEMKKELEIRTQQLEMRKHEVKALHNKLRIVHKEMRQRGHDLNDANDTNNTSLRISKPTYELNCLDSAVPPSQLLSSSSSATIPVVIPPHHLPMSNMIMPLMPIQEMAMAQIAPQLLQQTLISTGLPPHCRPPPSYSSVVNTTHVSETTIESSTSTRPRPQMPKLPRLVINESSSNGTPAMVPKPPEFTSDVVGCPGPAEVSESTSVAHSEDNGYVDVERGNDEKIKGEEIGAHESVGIRRNGSITSTFPQHLVNQNHGALVFCRRCRLFLPPHPVSVANHLQSKTHQNRPMRASASGSTYTQFGKLVQPMPPFIDAVTVVTEEQRRAESAVGNSFFDNGLDIVKSICSLCEETVTTQSYKVHESLATHRQRVAKAKQDLAP